MGIGEVAEMTGLPQGTAHRLLHSLQSRGYVRQDSSRKYSVGTAAPKRPAAPVRPDGDLR